MGQSDSKTKIEQEFQIFKIEKDGNTLLKSKKDNKQYLMRVVTCATQADMDRLKALLECRAQLKNHHILSLVEIKEKQQDFICSIHYKMYLVLEYSFKNVAQEIKERSTATQKNYFQESDIWSILYSCCTALNVLFSNGATHESLTAEQIFINKDGFVKITEPLLFGLEKNHLEAMRTKQLNYINVHLSPEIIGCLDDQNFFYYDKEKSDIFVLAMIIIDIALLSNNYLYNVAKKKPMFQEIENLLNQVGERYSHNLATVLGEMVRVQSRLRPNLAQIIEKVEKYNNIGEDFTVESESNLKSNELCSSRGQEKIIFQKSVKVQGSQRKQNFVFQENKRKTEPIGPNVYVGASMHEQSLSIKEPSLAFNPQNFDGRVFASTSHHSNFQSAQGIYSNYQHDANILPFPVTATEKVIPNGIKQNFDLYQRSKSIDSIKVTTNQYSRVDQVKVFPSSATKTTAPFYNIEGRRLEPEIPITKPRNQVLYTHDIPEIYNLLMKNTKNAPKPQLFSKQQKEVIEQGHVATPQFHSDISKVNRFTSFKNFPYESVSRNGEEHEPPSFQGMPGLQLKKNISHTQSEKQPQNSYELKEFERTPDPFAYNNANTKNHYAGSSATSFKPNPNPFAGSTPFPGSPPLPINSVFANSATGKYGNNNPIISSSFIPSYPGERQAESYTCRSGFSHLSLFHKDDDEDIKLQFVRQQIPERGRYEGYKFNDERNGHGSLHFKDGGHYEGEWKNDKMHGFGKLYYENGKIAYEGHWENDQFNGQGRVYNSEPISFEGQFNYKDFSQLGNRWIYYQGQFKSDSKHGKGYIKLTNGQMYEGIFDHDMIQGNGIFYKRSGEIIIGFWIDNKLFLNQSYEHEKK